MEFVKLDFDGNDLSFLLKSYNPDKSKRAQGLTTDQINNTVLQNQKLKDLIKKISHEWEGNAEKTAEEIVYEIGHLMTLPAVRTTALLLRVPIRHIIDGIYINKNGLEQLSMYVSTQPVVLMPSHRSYLDFLLVSYVMFEHNIQIPAIAAAQDFMNMKFVTSLLRRCGAFFMRRSFASDQLYKLIFTLYLQTILCSYDMPIEFFIEGTRSRTAKSLHPRLGLLSMVVEAYLRCLVPDIHFFPISISYERTLEENLFARELLGIPKPKESTVGLLKAVKSLANNNYGNIYINVSQPISLHEICQRWCIGRIPHGIKPRNVFAISHKEREMINKLGFLIIDKINFGMRVYLSAVIGTIVLHFPDGIKHEHLSIWVSTIKHELEKRGATVHPETLGATSINDSLQLLSSTDSIYIDDNGIIHPAVDYKPSLRLPLLSYIITDINKITLSSEDKDNIFSRAFVYLKLAHYRNQILNWFVLESMLLLCLQGQIDITIDILKRKFYAIHMAVCKEFILPQKPPKILFKETLQNLSDRGLIEVSHSKINLIPQDRQTRLVSFLGHLVQPFIAGVWVMCLYLISLNGSVQTVKLTYENSQLLAMKLIHRHILNNCEILSLDMMKNAMSSLNEAGLLMEPELEVEGRDRLVKVAHLDKLKILTDEIGAILFSEEELLPITVLPVAKL